MFLWTIWIYTVFVVVVFNDFLKCMYSIVSYPDVHMLPEDLWCWDDDQVYKGLQVLQQSLCGHLLRHTLKIKSVFIYVFLWTEFRIILLIVRTLGCLGHYSFILNRKRKSLRYIDIYLKNMIFHSKREKKKKRRESNVCSSHLQRKKTF